MAAALDARLERHRRIAAIRLIRQQWFELSNAPDQGKRLAALFSDRDPHVRSAATTLSFADGKAPPAILAAVVARFPNETDPKRSLLTSTSSPRRFTSPKSSRWISHS